MAEVDKSTSVEAMGLEMESMQQNNVCTLMEPPEWIKPIGNKWAYKKKRGTYGKVEAFKARVVVKGYKGKRY